MKGLSEEVREIMKEYIGDNSVAGVTVLAVQDGKEICDCQEGMADIENGRAMKRDTIFRLYSQTKPVTGAAAMILMERGKLDLYQPVAEYLPAFREQKIWRNGRCEALLPGEREMLVVDLLRMTSGLIYGDTTTEPGRMYEHVFEEGKERMHTPEAMTTRNVADALVKCPLLYAPGQGWQYGSSADVLGAVIEAASGKRFGEFLQEEIFEPLGMKDTAFWVPEEKQDRLAAVYQTEIDQNGQNVLKRYTQDHLVVANRMEKSPVFESGGAGLASTLDDYMKFAQMLMQGGSLNGVRVLSEKTTKYFTSPELMPVSQKVFSEWVGLDGYSYGNLMRVCKNPAQCGYLAMQDEYGWDGWLGVYFANLPNEKTTILMGMQKVDAGTFSMTRKIRNRIVSKL